MSWFNQPLEDLNTTYDGHIMFVAKRVAAADFVLLLIIPHL